MSGLSILRSCALATVLAIARVAFAAGEESEAEPPALAGRWIMVQVMPALTSLPFVGDVELTTITAAFVVVEQSGTSLLLQDQYCFTEVRMTPPVASSHVPEAFTASLSPAPRAAFLEPFGGGWNFAQASVVEVRGALIDDPTCDLLPSESLDPRIWDQDADGYPGMTVGVTVAGIVSGETYIVQRLEFALRGQVVDNDTIAGAMTWKSEQNVIAASNPLLLMSYQYHPHPDPSRSVFVMRRAEPSWTCSTIRELLPRLLDAAEGRNFAWPRARQLIG
jgi:hypothetical protein